MPAHPDSLGFRGDAVAAYSSHLDPKERWLNACHCAVLKRCREDLVEGSKVSALIPVAQTLGMNCAWSPRNVPASDRERLIAHLTDPKRALPDDFDRSETTLIRPFGIFMAHEGKNRVSFLDQAGLRFMPSLVTAVDYPSADRLRLFEVADGCEPRVLCSLDNEHLVPLQSPSWSIPLLAAYGVSNEKWPDEYPELDAVLDAIRTRAPDHLDQLHPVALTDLKEQLAVEATEPTPEVLVGHKHIRIHPRPLLLPFAATLALLLTASVWPKDWGVESNIAAFCFGVITCISVCATLPIVAVREDIHRMLLRPKRPKGR
jgi:hypothetical protein